MRRWSALRWATWWTSWTSASPAHTSPRRTRGASPAPRSASTAASTSWPERPRRSPRPLDDHGDALAAADAEGGETDVPRQTAQAMHQRDEDSAAAGADGVAERDGAP